MTEEGDNSPEEFCDLLTGINASSVSASFALRCGLRTRSGLLHEQQIVSLKPSGPKSDQYKFSPYTYSYIIKRKVHENQQNDQLSENALIFRQILSTSFSRKFMEISMENLYVDIGV